MTPSSTDVTIIGAMVTGFLAISTLMLKQTAKEREADRSERKELVRAIRDMAKSSEKVAKATERSANEAKQRNGHLAELMINNTSEIVGAVSAHHDQTVDVQNVNKQIVKK
jgi:hypothetical protein